MNQDDEATSSAAATLSCHYLPFANNPRFVGRQEYLSQVGKVLLPKEPPSQASTIITGLGGVGKTEIALHFVYEHINEYPVILWISAESGERMLQAYVEIARRMGLESADTRSDPKHCMTMVLEWLASTSSCWLVVFDNATNAAFQDLKRSWPSGKTGSILLTTRNNEFSLRIASLDVLNIEPLNSQEGSLLLRSLLSSPDDVQLIDTESSVTELVRLLGGLPLALSQIAGFMKASRCPASQMLRIYQDPKNAIHIHSKPPMGSTFPYDETVATVWNISIQALSSQALALLETMSFLDPDGIPEDFLVEFKDLGGNISTSDLDFRLAIEELTTQSLIKSSQTESLFRPPTLTAEIFHSSDVEISVSSSEIDIRSLVAGIPQTNISMHRLIQSQSLGLSSKQTRNQAFQNAQSMLFALSEKLGVVGEADLDCNWAFYERVMPHILSLEEKYRTMQDELPLPSILHQVLAYSLMFLHGRGSYNDAIKIFPTVEKVCKGKNEPLLLASIYDVQGDMLRNSNFAERAHEMYSKALDVLLTSDSSQDRDRMLARAYSTLGNSSLAMNNITKSLDYHQQGLLLQEKLTTLHNELVFGNALALAYINASWAYWKSGQLDSGSEIIEKALKLIDNLNNAPNKVWARRSWGLRVLGNIRIAQGRDVEAFEIHQEAFKIQIENFGYEHHETGDLCYKLSYHYHHFSNIPQAIKYLRAALNVYSIVALDVEVQGATARAMYKLSVLLMEIGQEDEARDIKAKAADLRQTWAGIPPEEKDTVVDYDLLVPYWGQ